MLRSYLIQLKAKTGMSWAQIEVRSGVPTPTIQRIFRGDTPNPGFETVSSIISAMGGSLGDISPGASISPAPAPRDASQAPGGQHNRQKPGSPAPRDASSCISLLQAQIADLKRTRMILSIAVAVTVFVILLALILDVFNGGIGYIRF